jgi:energy-coupling factor transporter transmembrane protein EcfT
LVVAFIVTAGIFAQVLVFGEIVIAVYAVLAFIKHISSRTTFLLALFALLIIVFLLTVQGNDTPSDNFAVYTFLLMVVGTISLGLEVRRDNA